MREEIIDAKIADALTDCDRVLTVYGGAHLVQSRPVFEQMLGPGEVTHYITETKGSALSTEEIAAGVARAEKQLGMATPSSPNTASPSALPHHRNPERKLPQRR